MEALSESYRGDDQLRKEDQRVGIDQNEQYLIIIKYQMEEKWRGLLFQRIFRL